MSNKYVRFLKNRFGREQVPVDFTCLPGQTRLGLHGAGWNPELGHRLNAAAQRVIVELRWTEFDLSEFLSLLEIYADQNVLVCVTIRWPETKEEPHDQPKVDTPPTPEEDLKFRDFLASLAESRGGARLIEAGLFWIQLGNELVNGCGRIARDEQAVDKWFAWAVGAAAKARRLGFRVSTPVAHGVSFLVQPWASLTPEQQDAAELVARILHFGAFSCDGVAFHFQGTPEEMTFQLNAASDYFESQNWTRPRDWPLFPLSSEFGIRHVEPKDGTSPEARTNFQAKYGAAFEAGLLFVAAAPVFEGQVYDDWCHLVGPDNQVTPLGSLFTLMATDWNRVHLHPEQQPPTTPTDH